MDEPRKKYAQHKANAQRRGIEFDITFEEWWAIWEPRYAERGPYRGQLGMCRTRDEGAYRPGNVRLDTPRNNSREHHVVVSQRQFAQAWDDNPDAADWVRGGSCGGCYLRPDRALMQAQEAESE